MQYAIHAQTDLGHGREVNEDAFAYCPDLTEQRWFTSRQEGCDAAHCELSTDGYRPLPVLGSLLIVADGMGGASAGEVASAMAIATLQRLCTPQRMQTLSTASDEDVHRFFCDAVEQADQEIRAYTLDHFETIGMGTTLVVVWVREGRADVAWCGDSRAYLYTPSDGLRRLSTDHSYVQQLCSRGEITEDEMLTHPDSNLLTRCVGDTDYEAKADALTIPLQPNSLLMLCSDGLSGYSYERDVNNTIYRHFTGGPHIPLVDLALQLEAQDNITVLTLSLIDDNQQHPTISLKTRFRNLF